MRHFCRRGNNMAQLVLENIDFTSPWHLESLLYLASLSPLGPVNTDGLQAILQTTRRDYHPLKGYFAYSPDPDESLVLGFVIFDVRPATCNEVPHARVRDPRLRCSELLFLWTRVPHLKIADRLVEAYRQELIQGHFHYGKMEVLCEWVEWYVSLEFNMLSDEDVVSENYVPPARYSTQVHLFYFPPVVAARRKLARSNF